MSNTISKSVFTFFNKLEKNNNRDWFNENKIEFKKNEKEVKIIYNNILEVRFIEQNLG